MGAAEQAPAADAQALRLTDAVKSMTGIVDLIDNIAGQVNILALNAAIESARAEETGSGFAVVASEAQSLVSQATQSTNKVSGECGSLNTTISEDVADAIAAIKHAIITVSKCVTSPIAAVEAQSTVTNAMSTSMPASRGRSNGYRA